MAGSCVRDHLTPPARSPLSFRYVIPYIPNTKPFPSHSACLQLTRGAVSTHPCLLYLCPLTISAHASALQHTPVVLGAQTPAHRGVTRTCVQPYQDLKTAPRNFFSLTVFWTHKKYMTHCRKVTDGNLNMLHVAKTRLVVVGSGQVYHRQKPHTLASIVALCHHLFMVSYLSLTRSGCITVSLVLRKLSGKRAQGPAAIKSDNKRNHE